MIAPAADLDRRFYAFAIDRALAWGLSAAAGVVLAQVLGPDRIWVTVAAIVGVVLLVGAVFTVVLGLTGASPGLRIAGLRLVREGGERPIGVGPALLRQLVLGVAALPTLGLGVATLAWTAAMDPTGRRRGWHDHLVGSAVVDARPAPAAEPEPDEGPRGIVNLTALRLVPTPSAVVQTPPRVPRPAAPPPSGPPAVQPLPVAPTAARHAARHAAAPTPPTARPAAESAPAVPARAVPAGAVPAGAGAAPAGEPPASRRQQLGYPLLPQPRPEPAAVAAPGQPLAPSAAHPAPAAATPAPARRGGAHAARPPAPEGPVRWRIGFDSGESLVVEGLVLIGRRPEPREGEQVHHLVALPSHDMSLSKTHAQLQVAADGALVVLDRGSTNGSILIRQGVPRGLHADRAATLVDGDRVRFGDREMSVAREN